MAKRRKKRSILSSTFYRIYFAAIAVCVVAIIVGAVILNGILKDYEATQPIYVAKDVAALFESGNFESLFDLDTSMQDIDSADRDFYIEKLKEYTDGKTVTWSEASGSNAEQKVYTVMLDGTKFADFTLIPSGITTEHGNKVWTLNSITTNISIEPEATPEPEVTPEPTPEPDNRIVCTLTIPGDSTATVDGEPLTENEILKSGIACDAASLIPESITAPTFTQYAFYHETGTPEIVVTDKYGNTQTLKEDGEYTWSCDLPEYPGLKEQVEPHVITVAQKLAAYSSKDAKKGAITQYCASKSPAMEILDNYDTQWGSSHKSMSFENIVTSDYHLYSDNCFSCHISFDYVASFNDSTTTTYPTAYTFYFINEDGKTKLYNFTLY